MITEEHLRAALHQEALDAPALVAPRARTRTRPAARRVIAGLAVAAAVAGVGLAATALTGSGGSSHNLPALGPSTGTNLTYSFSVNPVPGYVTTERDIRAQRQSLVLGVVVTVNGRNDDGSPGLVQTVAGAARVDVYQAGAYDPTAAKNGLTVTINGRSGYFGPVPVQLDPSSSDTWSTVPAIVWEYAPGAWAMAAGMDPEHQTQAVETRVAAAVVAERNPVLLPAKLSAVPAGLVRTQLRVQTPSTPDSAAFTLITISFRRPDTPSNVIADDYTITMTLHPGDSGDGGSSSGALSAPSSPSSPGGGSEPTTAPSTEIPSTDASTAAPSASSTDPVALATISAAGKSYVLSTVHIDNGSAMYANAAGSPLTIMINWTNSVSQSPDPRWADFVPAPSLTDQTTWYDAITAIP